MLVHVHASNFYSTPTNIFPFLYHILFVCVCVCSTLCTLNITHTLGMFCHRFTAPFSLVFVYLFRAFAMCIVLCVLLYHSFSLSLSTPTTKIQFVLIEKKAVKIERKKTHTNLSALKQSVICKTQHFNWIQQTKKPISKKKKKQQTHFFMQIFLCS